MGGQLFVAIAAGVLGERSADLSPLRELVPGEAPSATAESGAASAGAVNDGAIMIGGYCSPFDLAACFLLAGGAVIARTWGENYGTSAASSKEGAAASAGVLGSLSKGVVTIANDRRVLLTGSIASCFEAAMYSFVFMWTPALAFPEGEQPPYGKIFATMMVCSMAGTRIFSRLVEDGVATPELMLRGVFVAAALFFPCCCDRRSPTSSRVPRARARSRGALAERGVPPASSPSRSSSASTFRRWGRSRAGSFRTRSADDLQPVRVRRRVLVLVVLLTHMPQSRSFRSAPGCSRPRP